jgi:hypothetical protein
MVFLLLVGGQEVSLAARDRIAGAPLRISDAQVLCLTIPGLFCQGYSIVKCLAARVGDVVDLR